jgi:hypothetical protein
MPPIILNEPMDTEEADILPESAIHDKGEPTFPYTRTALPQLRGEGNLVM